MYPELLIVELLREELPANAEQVAAAVVAQLPLPALLSPAQALGAEMALRRAHHPDGALLAALSRRGRGIRPREASVAIPVVSPTTGIGRIVHLRVMLLPLPMGPCCTQDHSATTRAAVQLVCAGPLQPLLHAQCVFWSVDDETALVDLDGASLGLGFAVAVWCAAHGMTPPRAAFTGGLNGRGEVTRVDLLPEKIAAVAAAGLPALVVPAVSHSALPRTPVRLIPAALLQPLLDALAPRRRRDRWLAAAAALVIGGILLLPDDSSAPVASPPAALRGVDTGVSIEAEPAVVPEVNVETPRVTPRAAPRLDVPVLEVTAEWTGSALIVRGTVPAAGNLCVFVQNNEVPAPSAAGKSAHGDCGDRLWTCDHEVRAHAPRWARSLDFGPYEVPLEPTVRNVVVGWHAKGWPANGELGIPCGAPRPLGPGKATATFQRKPSGDAAWIELEAQPAAPR